MFRYYYDETTGAITRKNKGNLQSIEPNPYIDSIQDVNITQYTVDPVAMVLTHSPTLIKTRTR